MSDLPADWNVTGRVAIDLETRDDKLLKLGPGPRRGGYIVGYALGFEGGGRYYLPVRHAGGDNMDLEQVEAYIRHQLRNFTGILCGANFGYDLDYLLQAGMTMPRVAGFRDPQIAEPILDELQFSYSLDRIAQDRLGQGKEERTLMEAAAAHGFTKQKDVKANLWQLPGRYVGEYAEADADLPLRLLAVQEREIEAQGLQRIYSLENELMPYLVEMRRRGVRIDMDQLDRIDQLCIKNERAAADVINRETGIKVGITNWSKNALLAKALERAGHKINLTPTGLPQVKNDWLNSFVGSKVAQAILDGRRWNKLRGTFVNSIRQHEVKGRIHCTFNQLRRQKSDDGDDQSGARFGRMSSADPNMQQQPARDPEMGPMWRSIYLPDEGCEWASLDYSQQEPRWIVHYAETMGLRAAKAAADRYRTNPDTDFHQMMADMAGIDRKPAKTIFLGICYGMGGAKLCDSLDLPTMVRERKGGEKYLGAGEEGQRLLDTFDQEVPFVRQLAKAATRKADETGHITTILGRRCRFPDLGDGIYDWTYKALNRLIQGSSGDQTKQAIIECGRAGLLPQLQVHDELGTSIRNRGEADAIREIMETCVPMTIPSKVDVEIGPSWGESM